MFINYQIDEEEKVQNSYKTKLHQSHNYHFSNSNKSSIRKKINLNLSPEIKKFDNNYTSAKCFKNYQNIKNEILNIHSKNIFKKSFGNRKCDYEMKNISNQKSKREKKKTIEQISLNKDELYYAFIHFQKLIEKEVCKNPCEEYIKNKLFNFAIEQKNNDINKKTLECHDNFNEDKISFNMNNYFQMYKKTFSGYWTNKNEYKKISKSFSYSYSEANKNNIINNLTNLSAEKIKDVFKNNSQIFDEYLLTDYKKKDKTNSQDFFKYYNHDYSFDARNKDKNEISFHSIPEKEKTKDKFFYYNNYLVDNCKSYEKEFIGHKSPNLNNNKSHNILENNRKKLIFDEDLLIIPNFKKKEKINLLELNTTEDNEDNDIYKNYLDNKILIDEKLTISNSKKDKEKSNSQIIIKTKESFVEPEKNYRNEIKVNKNKALSNKEKLIEEKISELDEEIKRFHEERNKLNNIKNEYEELKKKLSKDIQEYNLKKQVKQKYFKGKFFMNITQYNQSLILNNEKKSETIKLLKKRIYKLEKIIKNKNKNSESKKIQKNIIKHIRENNFNVNTKKKNDNKNKNEYSLKNRRINLKKNIRTNSMEKLRENFKDIIHQNVANNINLNNNLNKLYFDSKINKKSTVSSYNNNLKIKKGIINPKFLNLSNFPNNSKKYFNASIRGYNMTTIERIGKKDNRNNSINIINLNKKESKNDDKIYQSNLHIYKKFINRQKEAENKYKNINSERDLCQHKKIMKKLKTDFYEKDKDKYKRTIQNNYFIENKKASSNNKKSQINNTKLDLRININKNKSNSNLFEFNKVNAKKFKYKNASSQIRNAINNSNIYLQYLKKENNSLDEYNQNIKEDKENNEMENDNNIEGYDFIIPEKYRNKKNGKIINSINSEGKTINIYEDNKKEIIFKSGVRKEVFSDGYQLINFPNGDMKQKFVGKNQKIMYFYYETNTVQTTYRNGINIFKFSNGQIEKHYPDGSKYIIYTNGFRRRISKDGKEEIFPSDEIDKNKNEDKKNDII